MKNILLTGGAGYIGSHVANLLLDKGYNVSIIDNLITGNKYLIPKKATFYNCDIDDKRKVTRIIKQNNFELVMHFAGLISVEESIKQPKKYNKFNFIKAKKFLNICFESDIKKVIFSSTASVYSDSLNKNVSEIDKIRPLSPYAKTKLKLEKYLINASKSQNIKYIILRYFNVAGADKKLRSGLVSKYSTHLIKIASEVAIGLRDKLIINGDNYDTKDGSTIRDYIHVSDLAEMHLVSAKYLVKNSKSNIFNCGYGKGYSVKEVIKTYNKFLKKKIKYEIGPRRPGDSKFLVANTNKFKKIMNWKPKFNDLKVILKTSYKWEMMLNKRLVK